MSFHLENINLIEKCNEDLLLYSPSTTQHKFLYLKIPIFVKSRVSDGLCSKNEFSLNINLIGKCNEDLLLYSASTTRHNFLFFKIPIFVKSWVSDGLCFEIVYHVPRHTMRVIARRATMLAGNRSQDVIEA